MKIMKPFNPKSVCGTNNLDTSKFGFHAQQIGVSDLNTAPHGIVLIGLADDTGIKNVGGRLGAKEGPMALRQKLYKFTNSSYKKPFYDLGDIIPSESIEETHAQSTSIIKKIHEAGHFPIVIGGGHDLAYPEALALLESKPGRKAFLNIDAHLDVRPTNEGITSGSPWFLLRENPLFDQQKCHIAEFGLQTHCNANALLEYAKKHKFTLHWLQEIKNPKQEFAKLLQKLSKFKYVQVSLDIDSVQWSDAPGASAPQNLGFQAKEAVAFCFHAGKNPKVGSFGLYELSPALDQDGKTASLAAHCVFSFLEGYGNRK